MSQRMWVNRCLASSCRSHRWAVRPQARSCCAACSSVSRPGTWGYSHSPARSPVSGRCRRATPSGPSSRNTVFSSRRFSFFGARTGSSRWQPCSRAAQNAAAGQLSHRGALLGRHTPAPRSISAWLKAPGASRGIAASIHCRNCRRFFWSRISSRQPPTRAATRSTLPSTAGTGSPKAMDKMAPAV